MAEQIIAVPLVPYNVPLPVVYERAVTALAQCQEIDECQSWANKAEALASYAKQAEDDSLRVMADRIQARAVRRCGELLQEIEPQKGGDRRSDQWDAAVPLNRTQAAEDAGLSERQRKTALRVANIPEDIFVEAIEDDKPPTVTQLAELGTQRKAEPISHLARGTGNNEWYTPAQYIELARQVLGVIDLDPATSAQANITVQARQIMTMADDGLQQEWRGTVWLNPPYAQPHIRLFMEKLVQEVESGNVTQAIALTNNSADTSWFQDTAWRCSAICFTRGRISFIDPDGNFSASPLQGQSFFYFGPHVEHFSEVFRNVGFVAEVKS